MVDKTKQTPLSFGSQVGQIPQSLFGSSTIGFASLNFQQNTETAGVDGAGVSPIEYPHSRSNVSPSGHVLQFNDTPAGERVLLKHRSGTAVDMLPDGTLSISSKGKTFLTVRADMTVVVNGNVSWMVDGDFDLDVKGNFNVKALNLSQKVDQNISMEAAGGSIDLTAGANIRELAKGSKSTTALSTITSFSLGSINTISQGGQSVVSQGPMTIAGAGGLKMSAQGGMDIAAPSINMGANSMTVVGATGTIGGAGITMYADNMHAQNSVLARSMQASTFHGDLAGTARDAQEAAVAGGLGSVVIGPFSNVAVDNSGTALPNGALMTDYLTVSDKGIIQVNVDADGEIRRAIDRTEFNAGVSRNSMGTRDVRSAMHDEANVANSTFTGNQVANGTLNPSYASYTPPGVNRAVPADASTYLGTADMGNSYAPTWIKPGPKPSRRSFLPDFNNYITNTAVITESTTLLGSIKLSTFLREI